LDGNEIDIKDIVNPPGVFENGIRQREYSTKDLLPLSGRLIPEFTQRRSIKDMFSRKPSSSFKESNMMTNNSENETFNPATPEPALTNTIEPSQSPSKAELYKVNFNSDRTSNTSANSVSKRARKESASAPPPKRGKSGGKSDSNMSGKGQQSLMGFFKPKKTQGSQDKNAQEVGAPSFEDASVSSPTKSIPPVSSSLQKPIPISRVTDQDNGATTESTDDPVIDPIVSKESWSKLFTKKATPRCEEHQEPCMMLTTKKPGINCGRSFWMCSRPLGPTGQKEKGTQWRCKTFIWASDWNGQE
jgi:AP endonuclease-2